MRDFKVLTDSCCDLSHDILEKFDIDVIPYYVSFDSKNYFRDRIDISVDDFFSKLEADKNLFPKTSFPSMSNVSDFFTKYLKNNLDILFISMTSKFSGGFQAVLNISEALKSEYPEANITVVDSKQVSVGQGLLAIQASKMQKNGCSIFQTADFIDSIKDDTKLFATVNSLSYLQRGGRIGKVSAIAGNILNIKPIISVKNGELYPYSKIRGRKKAIEEIINLSMQDRENKKDSYDYAIFHSCAQTEAESIKDILKDKFSVDIGLPIMKIGTVIGTHIGPTTLAITSVKKYLSNDAR